MKKEVLNQHNEMLHFVNYQLVKNKGKNSVKNDRKKRKVLLALEYFRSKLSNRIVRIRQIEESDPTEKLSVFQSEIEPLRHNIVLYVKALQNH